MRRLLPLTSLVVIAVSLTIAWALLRERAPRGELLAGSKVTPSATPYQNIPGLRESDCHDGIDNDGDGRADCDDPDCSIRRSCRSFGLPEFTLRNGVSEFRFVRGPWDMALESVRNVATGRRYSMVPGPLWSVTLRAGDGTRTVIYPGDFPATFYFDWRDAVAPGRTRSLVLTWRGIQIDAQNSIDVVALFKLGEGEALVQTRLAVTGSLTDHSVFETEFPRLDIDEIDGPGDNLLLYPSRKSGGGLITAPELAVARSDLAYPSNYQMGIAAYYNPAVKEGLYFSCDDGDGWYKRYSLEGRGTSFYLGMQNVPADSTIVTSYVQPYRQRFGPFEGDWYDAAMIYREWALQQDWVPERWETRTDMPESLKFARLGLFLKSEIENVPTADFVSIVEAYRDRFGLTSMIALLRGWDTTGDTTGRYPPDHFPPKADFAATIPALKAISGMTTYVIASTGSIGYDPRTPSYAAENAGDHAYRDELLQPIMRGPWVRMDSCTSYWQQKDQTLRIDSLVNQYGCDGSYFDSFVINRECYEPAHSHTLGGGTYIHDCIRANLQALFQAGRALDADFFLGEEPPTENFIDLMQFREGYFCVAPLGDASELHVPLFQTIYHEYAPCLISSKIRKSLLDDGTYTALDADLFQAHGFTIGNRLNEIEVVTSASEGPAGWLLNRPDMQGHFLYMDQLTAAADYAKHFLTFGRLMRPLDATVTRVDTGVVADCPAMHEAPVIKSSVWRSSDGAIGLVFTNWTDQSQSIQYEFRLADYELPPGSYVLSTLDATGTTPIASVQGDFSRSETLPPKSVLVLELR